MPLKVEKNQRHCGLEEACRETGVEREVFLEFVSRSWIHTPEIEPDRWTEEDLARARLIHELQEDFGVNDESVPIILHLLDQLHALRALMRRAA